MVPDGQKVWRTDARTMPKIYPSDFVVESKHVKSNGNIDLKKNSLIQQFIKNYIKLYAGNCVYVRLIRKKITQLKNYAIYHSI